MLADPFSILFMGEAQGAFGASRTDWLKLKPSMHLPSSGYKGKGRGNPRLSLLA